MSRKDQRLTDRGFVRVALMLMGSVLLVATSVARSLPILFSPPLHYQVLRKLGQRGKLGYTERLLPPGEFGTSLFLHEEIGSNGAARNRSVLTHWLQEARKLGANALLLRPFGKPAVPQYEAEAIRVRRSPCTLPFQCWSVRTIITGSQQLRHVRHEDGSHITSFRRAFGVSIAVGPPTRMALKDRSGTLQSSVQGHLRCPVRLAGSYFPTILPTLASAVVGADGQVATRRLIIFRIGGDMGTNQMIAYFLRHWRFTGRGTSPPPVHLLMDWHLVPLEKGQPLPQGVVCVYPVYPASGWSRGKMIRHLRWPVYTLREGGKKEFFAANPVQAR